ncbi:MAG: diguanylate cyclase [Rudaea sp.]|uniref:diguanylate cyclase domain-containing protein n=1 Tax=Rudaea sp. TaxID=2136325 RepID=UPI0039E23FC8
MNSAPGARESLPATASFAHIGRALLSISALAIIVVGAGAFLLSYHFLHEQTARHLQTLAGFAARESRSAIESRDTKAAEEILQSIPKDEGIVYAEIRDSAGTTLARIDRRTNGWADRLGEWIGNEHIEQDVIGEGGPIGSIALEGGSMPVLRALRSLLVWFVLGGSVVALCALSLARAYTRRFTQPIRQLRAVVEHLIQERDFRRRAPSSSLAEIEDLRLELNALLDEISLRDRLLTQSNAALQRVAYVDALTGLPNRAMFEPMLQQTIAACDRDRTRAALFYLDIDAFKSVNDGLGHAAGDELLSRIAARLRAWRPHETTATRIGGDEFIVLLSPLANDSDLDGLVAELHAQLELPMQYHGLTIHPSASVGISVYPDAARDAEDLLHLADRAMYATKSRRYGQGRVTHWQANRTPGTLEPANSDQPATDSAI